MGKGKPSAQRYPSRHPMRGIPYPWTSLRFVAYTHLQLPRPGMRMSAGGFNLLFLSQSRNQRRAMGGRHRSQNKCVLHRLVERLLSGCFRNHPVATLEQFVVAIETAPSRLCGPPGLLPDDRGAARSGRCGEGSWLSNPAARHRQSWNSRARRS